MKYEKRSFDLYVRGEIPSGLAGSLVVAASRRHKIRTNFSRWHDSQADLILLDLKPGKPGRVKAHLLSVDPWLRSRNSSLTSPYYTSQPNHGLNVKDNVLWATNLLFGSPLEVDLTTFTPRRALNAVPVSDEAPQRSTTSHFAFDLDRRYVYFHQSLLEQRESVVEATELSLVRLDMRSGSERIWKLQPPPRDNRRETHNFHSAFYFEEDGRKFVGLLRTGAIVESLAPHSVAADHEVIPMTASTIWIIELDDAKSSLQAELLAGVGQLGALALSHLDIDASGGQGFILYANYKQADVAEETHGENIYGEKPEDVAEHYSGMIVEPLNLGLMLRYERSNGKASLKTFKRSYDHRRTSLGHSWLPINIELDRRRTRLFCSFAGFHPRLLPKHIARAYGDTAVDPRAIRYVPPLLMRFNAGDLSPDYDAKRMYLSYTEPIAFTIAGDGSDEYVCTFSPETGLRMYHSEDLSQVICHAVSPHLMTWQDTHFRPDPAHMVYVHR
jgi:hypothetical protein